MDLALVTPTDLKRDKQKCQANMQTLPDTIVAKRKCKIQIPARYLDTDLASIGDRIMVTGMLAIIFDDGYYTVMRVPAMLEITPDGISKSKINGIEHMDFYFNPGSTVFKTLKMVKDDTLVYYLLAEFITNGNIPWFMEYEDVAKMFDENQTYAGTNVAANQEVQEMLTAFIGRYNKDTSKAYRTVLTSLNGDRNTKAVFAALKSVIHMPSNTIDRLVGPYLSTGISTALTIKSEQTDRIEDFLRR